MTLLPNVPELIATSTQAHRTIAALRYMATTLRHYPDLYRNDLVNAYHQALEHCHAREAVLDVLTTITDEPTLEAISRWPGWANEPDALRDFIRRLTGKVDPNLIEELTETLHTLMDLPDNTGATTIPRAPIPTLPPDLDWDVFTTLLTEADPTLPTREVITAIAAAMSSPPTAPTRKKPDRAQTPRSGGRTIEEIMAMPEFEAGYRDGLALYGDQEPSPELLWAVHEFIQPGSQPPPAPQGTPIE